METGRHKEIRGKNLMKSKRSELMTNTETSDYTTEAVRRHCTKTLKKCLERKPAHRQDVLSQIMVPPILEKKS